MSVSALSSSLAAQSSELSLLGGSSTSSTSSSTLSSLLGSSSSSTDAVTVDLSNYQQAVASGDSTAKASSLSQLKQDIATEQASAFNSILGSSSSTSDIGNSLLSSIYGGSSASGTGSILNTLA